METIPHSQFLLERTDGRRSVRSYCITIVADKERQAENTMKKFIATVAAIMAVTLTAMVKAEVKTDTIPYKGAWEIVKNSKADAQTLEIKVNYKVHLKDFDKTSKGGKTKQRLVSCDKSLRNSTSGQGGIKLVYKIGEDGSKKIAKAIK